MTDLHAALDTYHSLLDDEIGRESQWQLDDQQRRRGLAFATRPLTTVLRPRFLTTKQYHFLQGAIGAVMPVFAKVYRAALTDTNIRALLRLDDWEEKLIRVDPGFRDPSPLSRMDSFYLADDDKISFTEYNAETPAAPAYNDVLSEVFYGLPILREFERQYEVRPLPGRHHTMNALLDSYRQWGGRERPRIAILDWREVPTYSEFVLFKEYFELQGYECIIADPRGFEYRDGRLLADGVTPINLVYKRVLISELVQRGGLDHPVVRAVGEHAACMVNPFRCKILHKKASLAVMSDEANGHLFTLDERRAIDAYIPWTRLVVERRTTMDGKDIDLVPYLSEHKDEFVLKPNDEYGGKGIVLGWTMNQSEWDAALRDYLNAPTIAQRRVPLPSEPYPSMIDGNVKVFDRMLDTDPYIWYGDYMSGCLTRLSTSALLNVTAGGGSTVPTFVIEKRD